MTCLRVHLRRHPADCPAAAASFLLTTHGESSHLVHIHSLPVHARHSHRLGLQGVIDGYCYHVDGERSSPMSRKGTLSFITSRRLMLVWCDEWIPRQQPAQMLQTSLESKPWDGDQVTVWIIDGRELAQVLHQRSYPVMPPLIHFLWEQISSRVKRGHGRLCISCLWCLRGCVRRGSWRKHSLWLPQTGLCGGLEPTKPLWSNTSEKCMFITKVQPVSLMHWGLYIHRSREKQCEFEMYSCIPFLKRWKITGPKRINVTVNN